MYLSQNNGLSLQIQFPVFEVNQIIIRIRILELSMVKILCALQIYIFQYLKFCKCLHFKYNTIFSAELTLTSIIRSEYKDKWNTVIK